MANARESHVYTVPVKRAAIYCRISSDRTGAGLGVGRQEDDCRALAEQLGLAVVGVHTDNDLSAYSGKRRPGYEKLLDDIREHRIDAVIAWHTDRLHRSPAELERYISACDTHGTPTHTVTAGNIDLATPSGRLIARQLGAVARYEVEHMVERQMRAKLQKAQQGIWKGGRRPFGYEKDGVTVRQAEAALILRASEDILRGVSLRSITAIWQDSGIPTSTGAGWTDSAVRRVLMRPRNAGLMEHSRQIIGRAQWPAIVSEQIWRGVVAVLGDPTRLNHLSNARRWLGSGLYLCGVCGKGMRVQWINGGRANPYHAYTCVPSKHLGRLAAGVDEYVESLVIERLARPDLADLLATGEEDGTADIAVEIASLRGQLDELARLFAQRAITASQLATASTALQDQLETAEKRLAGSVRDARFDGLIGATDPQAAWKALGLDRQRHVIDALMVVTILPAPKGRRPGWTPGRRYFDPDTVHIEWKI